MIGFNAADFLAQLKQNSVVAKVDFAAKQELDSINGPFNDFSAHLKFNSQIGANMVTRKGSTIIKTLLTEKSKMFLRIDC